MPVTVRLLTPADRPAWGPLWAAYLTFYRCDLPASTTEITWARFFDPTSPMEALGAFDAERLVGFAHVVFHPSTWIESTTCYLEDLFVDESQRGRGVGRTLIDAVADLARSRDARRLYWLTHETNATARALYDRLAQRSGFIHYDRAL